MARGSYIEAIDLAEQGKFDEAEAKIKEGDEFFTGGHSAHAQLIQKEANGENTEVVLLLVHAEDQLMSAESVSYTHLYLLSIVPALRPAVPL